MGPVDFHEVFVHTGKFFRVSVYVKLTARYLFFVAR
jgi:hypothetical protein